MTRSEDERERREKQISRGLTERAVEELVGDRASKQTKRVAMETLAPWAEKLVRTLDDSIRVPGTNFRIGLDPILGFLLPGAGDAITGTGSIALLLLALKERVPTVALLRMVMNVGVDAVLGAIPIAGDAFDAWFKANRRNLEIIERHRRHPSERARGADYVVVGIGILLAIASVVIPILIFYGLGSVILRELQAAGIG